MHVEGRSTRIAFVNRCVDLDEIVVRTTSDVTAACRNNSGRYGTTQAKRVAHSKYPITNPGLVLRELRKWKIRAALDFDQGNVCPRIGPDYLRGVSLSGVRRHFDFFGSFNDVVVGYCVSIG